MPEISIVIITFNSGYFIKSCLNSIYTQDYRDFEVIVADNGSNDSTVSFIEQNYPEAILIKNKINLGAARVRNQGIEIAKAQWILTLDCDVVLKKDFLLKMISYIRESEERVGMFQPKILNIDGKTIYSCGIYLSELKRFYDIGNGELDNGPFNVSQDVFGVSSCAAFYSRNMLEEIKEVSGYFDERFFFLVEDVDLSWRAQKKGWKARYCPEAVCYHSGNSSGCNKKFRQYLCFRNRWFSILKNEDKKSLMIKLAYFLICYDIPRTLCMLTANRLTTKALREIVKFSEK
jgi:GT2 family glycosyltransferase